MGNNNTYLILAAFFAVVIFYIINSYFVNSDLPYSAKQANTNIDTCQELVKYAEGWEVLFLRHCNDYMDRSCTRDVECGPFFCSDGSCVIKPCTADFQCPNNLCGLHATPAPGFCTTTDII